VNILVGAVDEGRIGQPRSRSCLSVVSIWSTPPAATRPPPPGRAPRRCSPYVLVEETCRSRTRRQTRTRHGRARRQPSGQSVVIGSRRRMGARRRGLIWRWDSCHQR
jgi:hypothetical protein